MTTEEINMIKSFRGVIIRSIRLHRNIDYRDILQDLYLKILKNYEKFQKLNEDEKRSYTYQATMNLLYDMNESRNTQKRKGKTIGLFINGDGDLFSALQEKAAIYDVIELNETLERLKKSKFGDELIMNASGYTMNEIARLKKISLTATLQRCFQARKFLLS